ncbi:sensor histidine kinase [Nonomuraea africana]|uniref:histidine kinase n=1 Tax=Nonomuraea africana TaxID=46171 RepID=A0ABR9KV42_9ACTN|nr:sensor histidine kinase [Nonomuraea africana]MBE1565870.1 signal transduction histidine kinase [Nonomuraea africana]
MTQQSARALHAWSRRPASRDATLASALLAVCVLVNDPNTIVRQLVGNSADDGQIALWWVATVCAVGAVALRRRRPLPMLVVCALASAAHVAQAVPLMIIDLAVPILLYTIAARHRWAVSLAALAALLLLATGWSLQYALHARLPPEVPHTLHAVTTVPTVPGSSQPGGNAMVRQSAWANAWSGLPVLGSILAAAWAIGSSTRNRRAYLDQLHARAQDLERERDQQAALAVAAERGRISRELHDVVAHGLSIMVIQAQGGDAALDHRPADTRAALETIIKTGRSSLADMRSVLTAVGEVDDAWHPQPGLGQLSALLTEVRKAGTAVRLQIEGAPMALPSTADLSAYRIVQEALTNTIKHAGTGAKAEVTLSYHPTEVRIEVSDNGHSTTTTPDGGNGLRGMRERAKLLGGSLTAGPRPHGGFTVRAALPIRHDT